MKSIKETFGFKAQLSPQTNAATDIGDIYFSPSMKEQGIFKAYIPRYMYKPPFGYPRPEDLSLMQKLSKNPYIYSVMKVIVDEVSYAKFNISYRENSELKEKDKLKDTIKEITKFFRNPNRNKESFSFLRAALTRDILAYDSGVFVKVFNGYGKFSQLFARDGKAFLKNCDIYGYIGNRAEIVTPMGQPKYGSPIVQLPTEFVKQYQMNYSEQAAYFQYGTAVAASIPVPFGRREIMYVVQNPQSDSPYGISPIAILSDIIMTLVYGANFNLDFYMNNNMPEGIIQLLGAHEPEIKAFRKRIEKEFRVKDEVTGFMRRVAYKVPITGAEAKFIPFQMDPKTMQIIEQQEWFYKLVLACFGVPPDEMGLCYSEDTRVLTNNGLKYHWELIKEDKLATINEKNHKIEFLKPTSIHRYDVKDRIFHHYKNKCIDTLVSDNHRMYYRTIKDPKYRMAHSNEISQNTIKVLQGGLDWKGKDLEEIKIPLVEYKNNKDRKRKQQISFKINEFCEFLGYYLSEGSVLKKMNDLSVYKIKISQTNKEGIKKMNPLMNRMGFKREKTCWSLSNKSLARYLHQFGDSNSKYIPQEIKNLPKKRLRILFDALIIGDGHICKEGTAIRYHSSSKTLAEDVFEISLKLGYKSSIHTREFKNKSWHTAYTINMNSTQKEPKINLKKQRKEISYTGIMWCPKVYDRPFITERNGRIGIHYNTENSNKATGANQYRVFLRKSARAIMAELKYKIDHELISEWGQEAYDNLEFSWDDYDLDEEIKKFGLYQTKINMGVMSPEMVADKEGIAYAEVKAWKEEEQQNELDKMSAGQTNFNQTIGGGYDTDKKENKDEPNDESKNKVASILTKYGVGKKSLDPITPTEKKIASIMETNSKKIIDALDQIQ